MAPYHEKDIRAYFEDAFGYEGDVAESADKMVALFQDLGVDMYFDGDADEEHMCRIPVDSVLDQEEIVCMVKECMR